MKHSISTSYVTSFEFEINTPHQRVNEKLAIANKIKNDIPKLIRFAVMDCYKIDVLEEVSYPVNFISHLILTSGCEYNDMNLTVCQKGLTFNIFDSNYNVYKININFDIYTPLFYQES